MSSIVDQAQWAAIILLFCGPWFWPLSAFFFWLSWKELKK